MFSCAIAWEWRFDNPAKGIQTYPEEKRDRWLDEDELKRFWEALERYPEKTIAFIFKLLLLTGARKGEALNATWDQFDLENGVWTKPSHLTKQKKKERLPLSSEAVEILCELKKLTFHSPYFFRSESNEGKPIQEIKT